MTLDSTLDLSQLRAQLTGRVIVPADADYDEATTIFPGGIDNRPSAIARVADAADVSSVIALARSSGTELAVRSGGHSILGVTQGGIVLDLRDMNGLEIDPEARTAWAQTGLTAGEYTVAAGEDGLVTGFGDTASVGIGGITLGGGIGYLVRRNGLTIDDLLAAEIVTADGEVLLVDDDSHPDLFWAIRGGGGNFGVATRFKFRLHDIATGVGGLLFLPATPEVVANFLSEADAAPEELSTICNVMTAPPMPFVPEEYHGRPIVMAMMFYAGDPDAGVPVVDRFRKLATPITDMLRPMTYPEMYPPEEEEFHPTAATRNMFSEDFDAGLAGEIIEALEASTAFFGAAQLRVLGGAMARVPAEATAFPHRDRKIMTNVAAVYMDPAEADQHEEWVVSLSGRIRGDDQRSYVNFVNREGTGNVRNAYPGGTWDRLVEVKKRYDPDNLFRSNHNIPPSGEEVAPT